MERSDIIHLIDSIWLHFPQRERPKPPPPTVARLESSPLHYHYHLRKLRILRGLGLRPPALVLKRSDHSEIMVCLMLRVDDEDRWVRDGFICCGCLAPWHHIWLLAVSLLATLANISTLFHSWAFLSGCFSTGLWCLCKIRQGVSKSREENRATHLISSV